MSQQQRQQQQQLQGQKKHSSSSSRNSGGELQQLEDDQRIVKQQEINESEDVVGNENEEDDDDDDPPLPVGGMKNYSAEGQIKQNAIRKGDIQQQRPYPQEQQPRVIQQQQQQLQVPQQSSNSKQQSHGKRDLSSMPPQQQQQQQSTILEGVDTIGFQGTFRQDESNFISPNLNITDVSQDNINVSQVLEDTSFTQIVQKGSNNGNYNTSSNANNMNNNFYSNENNNKNFQLGKKSPLAGRREEQQQGQSQQQQQQQHLKLDSLNRDPLGMGVQSYNSSKQSMGMGLKINNSNNSINRGSNNNININLNGNFNNLSNYRSSQQQQQALPYQMNNNSNYNSANSRQDSQSSNITANNNNNNNNIKPNTRMLNNTNNVFNQNSNGSFNYGSMYGIMQSSNNQDAIMSRISRNNNNNNNNNNKSNTNSHVRSQISNSSNNNNNTLEEQFLDRGNASQSQRQPTDKHTKHFAPLEMETTKQGNILMIVNNEFFYDSLPYSYQSNVISKQTAKVLDRAFILQFFVPYLVAFLLHVLLWGLQRGIEDYCFYGAANTENFVGCKCSNFGSRFWTFVKQLLSWKLGVMVCKNIVLQEISEQDNNNDNKMKMKKKLTKTRSPPILESFIMFGAGIAVDFIMVVILDMSEDWYFYVAMSIIGFIVTLHSVKLSQLSSIFSSGRGLILYDMNLAFLICFGYFALPNIYSSLVTHNGYTDGRNTFLYIYPLIEIAMEIITNQVLDYAVYAQFFEYQLQLFIMGLRLGIMSSVTLGKFEFWYLGVFFAIKTVISTTGVLYINVRRAIYHSVPDSLRYLVSMGEIPEHVKGKHGFLLENLLWLLMFFWWIFTGTLVPGYVKSSLVIDDCAFNADTLFKASTWDRGFFTWIFVLIGTVLSLLLNVSLRYDMIKWVGAPQHNIVENILTRMFGWYLFQVALGIAYSFSIEKADSYSGF